MPDVTVPEEPMVFVKSEGVNYVPYTDHYDLQWKAPLDNGEPITAFTIIHYQVRLFEAINKLFFSMILTGQFEVSVYKKVILLSF